MDGFDWWFRYGCCGDGYAVETIWVPVGEGGMGSLLEVVRLPLAAEAEVVEVLVVGEQD